MCGKRSELSLDERAKIIALHKQTVPKHSMREIARITGNVLSTVYKTIDRFKKTNTLNSLPKSGRPSALNESDRCYLRLCSVRDRRKTLSVLIEDFNCERKIPVSNSVVNRSLHSWGMIGRVACRKPLLSSRNVKKKTTFCERTREVDQKKMIKSFIYG